LSRLNILRFSPLAGALMLLLAGCGGHGTGHVPESHSASTVPVTEPSTEGTGPESPLPASKGGISLSVAALPIGDGGSNPRPDGQDVCVDVLWLGTLHPGAMLTVTSVIVREPFTPVDVAPAGCTGDDGRPCVGLRLTAADNGGRTCAVGIKRTRGRAGGGALELAGQLSCSDSATCRQVFATVENKARDSSSAGFEFPIPVNTSSPPPTSTTPPPTSTTPPPTSTTPPPTSTTPPPPPPPPTATSSP
jgi:hypothetical protein